jgi:hypothetical protein
MGATVKIGHNKTSLGGLFPVFLVNKQSIKSSILRLTGFAKDLAKTTESPN